MSRQGIIDIATSKIGVTENPAGSNHSEFGEWFGLQGVPWCGIFCSYCYAHAGHQLKGDYSKGFASVPWAWQHYQKTTSPEMADLVIFDWDKGKKPETEWSGDHVGLFVEWIDKKAGTFYTIEGNTSIGNQSNGGAVMKRQRNMAFVQGFLKVL